ncbi:TPA: hypothetical protein HA259_07260 [Thermoplasmata archaeon]|nr:hypothetical protein [Thermoplasmata archaeon]
MLTTDWMCPTCGRDLQTTELIIAREDSPVPTVIGVLLIIAGVLNIVNGLLIGSAASILPAYGFCGVLEVLAGVVTIPGGFAAIGKKHFIPVFVVSIITLFSVGPCFISSIFGLIAVVGLLVARNEFES